MMPKQPANQKPPDISLGQGAATSVGINEGTITNTTLFAPLGSLQLRPGVPPVPEHYVPREAMMRELAGQLGEGHRATGTGRVVASGAGGHGKTVLARAYAHEFRNRYPGGCYALACETESLETGLASLVLSIGDAARASDRDKARYAQALLSREPNCLLILDNVRDAEQWNDEEFQKLLPSPPCHILVTTRAEHLPRTRGVSVGKLTEDEAFALLAKFRPSATEGANRDAITAILGEVEYLAAAVASVGAMMLLDEDDDWGAYAKRLSSAPVSELPDKHDVVRAETGYVGKTAQVLDDLRAKLHATEVRVLDYAALLPTEKLVPMWLERLLAADATSGGDTRLDLGIKLSSKPKTPRDVIARLAKLGLLSIAAESDTLLSVHRLHRRRAVEILNTQPEQLATLLDAIVAMAAKVGSDSHNCELLATIGRHPDFAGRCTKPLWDLAKKDSRLPNPNPGHPFRVLEDLVAYRSNNDVRTIEAVLGGLREIIDSNQHTDSKSPVCEIVMKSLDREIEHTESHGRRIILGTLPLPIDRVRTQRNKAIAILEVLARGQDLPSASDAVNGLASMLCIPRFRYGRGTTEDDLAAFLPEAKQAADILKGVACDGQYQVIRYQARRALLGRRSTDWFQLVVYLDGIGVSTQGIPNEAVFDALTCRAPARHGSLDYKNREEAARASCQATARSLWEQFGVPGDLISHLTRIWDELCSTKVRADPGLFLFSLAETGTVPLREFADCLIESNSPFSRMAIPVILRVLRTQDHLESFDELVLRLAESDEPEMRRRIASQMGFCLSGDSAPGPRELRLIEKLSKDIDAQTRASALAALGKFGNSAPRAALDVLVGSDFGNDSLVADEALSCLRRKFGIDPSHLTEADIDQLLGKLRRVEAIDDHHHHMIEFIEHAATRRPSSVIRMLLGRIDDSCLPGHEFKDGFRPIPHLADNLRLQVPDRLARLDLLREIRAQSLNDSWQHGMYLPRLFRDLITDLDDAVAVVAEWGREQDPAKVIASVRLLREMPDSLLFYAHSTFADILENAERLDPECHERVRGHLYSLAIPKGVRWVSPGEPDPLKVEQARTAAEFAEKYGDRPVVASFFRDLETSARHSLGQDTNNDQSGL